jgi:Domain of unknown function (DUF4265)
MDSKRAIQVRLKLDPNSWHRTSSEGIWVNLIRPLGEKAIVEVDNIPFYSRSISYRDKIAIAFVNNAVVFDSIVERGGHSTYRIFFETPNGNEISALRPLGQLGCIWERAKVNGGELFALDIPPEVDIYHVYRVLEEGQKHGLWRFEEGHVGHVLKEEPGPTTM